MITIAGTSIDSSTLLNAQEWNHVQQEMITLMGDSKEVFSYVSQEVFQFELTLRNNIIEAAKSLNRSGAEFTTFETSRCNEEYWHVTNFGGFQLRRGALPSDAIRDIFRNGEEYAFECATAMVIVYYRAVLASIDLQWFNHLFADMLLYDWKYDQDLRLIEKKDIQLPGDVVYFKNPEVNPETPEWQGENAVVMGNGTYYGHGIGITGARQIISVLNSLRKPGATQSAFLMEGAIRPDFAYLKRFQQNTPLEAAMFRESDSGSISAWIGSAYYEV